MMKIKLACIIFLAFFTSLFLLTAKADTDPFANGSFVYGNNTLTTANSKTMNSATYSIDFTTPPDGAKTSSDLCTETSATTLDCPWIRTTVSYDATTYKATLTTGMLSHTTYTYYVKGHEPATSPLSGSWHPVNAQDHDCIYVPYTNLVIPTTSDVNATHFYPVKASGNGTYDSEETGTLTTMGGNLVLRFDDFDNYYLYDQNGNQINNMSHLGDLTTLKYDDNEVTGQIICPMVK